MQSIRIRRLEDVSSETCWPNFLSHRVVSVGNIETTTVLL